MTTNHPSDVLCPLPRRIERVHVSITSPLVQPSPNGRRVGIRIVTFEACSGFTRVTARRIAQPPKVTFVTRLRSRQLPSETARQLPDLSTIIRVEPSSTDDSRLQGRTAITGQCSPSTTGQVTAVRRRYPARLINHLRRCSPSNDRAGGHRILSSQLNFFRFVADRKTFALTQCVFHLFETNFDFQPLAAIGHWEPKYSVVLRCATRCERQRPAVIPHAAKPVG